MAAPGGNPGDDRVTSPRPGSPADHPFNGYVAPLFDYCLELLHDHVAAADAVQQVLIAAEPQSGPVPEPESLRPQLYRLARRECQQRQPGQPGPVTGWEGSLGRPGSEDDTEVISLADLAAETRERDTLRLAEGALAELPERDREVLSLSFRHGIGRRDLAAILGESSLQVRMAVAGAISRFEKASAVAAAISPGSRPDCADLDKLLSGWEPTWPGPASRLRNRVARHIHSCWMCAESLDDLAVSAEWLSVVPLAYLAPGLRWRIDSAFDAAAGAYRSGAPARIWPAAVPAPARLPRVGRPRAVVALSAAAAIAVAAGITIYQIQPHSGVNPNLTAANVARGGARAPRLDGPALRQPPGARHGALRASVPVIADLYPRTAGVPPILIPPSQRHGSPPGPQPSTTGTGPGPTGSLSPPPSKSPKPTTSPSTSPTGTPSPSPTTTSPSPSPSPTTTSPSPSPSPTTTSPSPSPTTTSPSPSASPTSPAPSPS